MTLYAVWDKVDSDDDSGDGGNGSNGGNGGRNGGNNGGNNRGGVNNNTNNGTVAAAVTAVTAGVNAGNNNQTIDDEDVPETIGESDTPLTDKPKADGWALVNLIMSILAAVGAVIALIRRRCGSGSKILGIIAAIAAIALFIFTEDMSAPMIMTDKWTILSVILGIIGLASCFITKKE